MYAPRRRRIEYCSVVKARRTKKNKSIEMFCECNPSFQQFALLPEELTSRPRNLNLTAYNTIDRHEFHSISSSPKNPSSFDTTHYRIKDIIASSMFDVLQKVQCNAAKFKKTAFKNRHSFVVNQHQHQHHDAHDN